MTILCINITNLKKPRHLAESSCINVLKEINPLKVIQLSQ